MLSFTKVDPLDMEAYKEWIQRLHNEWPISEEMLFTGRIKKKKVIDYTTNIVTILNIRIITI